MAYSILNPIQDIRLGTIKLAKNREAIVVKRNDWDIIKGADLRIVVSNGQEKYCKDAEGNLIQNSLYHTYLLKRKEGTKATFYHMDENEEWNMEEPYYSYSGEVQPLK